MLIFHKAYNDFVFEKEYGWSLAFYKLCGLQYALTKRYDNYLLLDTDTYTHCTFAVYGSSANIILCYLKLTEDFIMGTIEFFVKKHNIFGEQMNI